MELNYYFLKQEKKSRILMAFVKTTGSTAVSNLLLPNDLLKKNFEQKK